MKTQLDGALNGLSIPEGTQHDILFLADAAEIDREVQTVYGEEYPCGLLFGDGLYLSVFPAVLNSVAGKTDAFAIATFHGKKQIIHRVMELE